MAKRVQFVIRLAPEPLSEKFIKGTFQYPAVYFSCSRNSELQPAFIQNIVSSMTERAMHNEICVMTSMSNALGITTEEKRKKRTITSRISFFLF